MKRFAFVFNNAKYYVARGGGGQKQENKKLRFAEIKPARGKIFSGGALSESSN